MSNIRIKPQSILSAGKKANIAADYLDATKKNLNSIKNQVDPQILSRNNVSGQFSDINQSLAQLSTKVRKIKSVTDQNVHDYENTEKNLVKLIPKSIPKIR